MLPKPNRSARHFLRAGRRGFTILELLVSVAVVSILLVVLASMSGHVQKVYRSSLGKAEQFREARTAFEAITSRLTQATLNTYWDYDNVNQPTRYMRQSELRFQTGPAATLLSKAAADYPSHAIFFQAPLGLTSDATSYGGLDNLLNTWGYFIEFGDDSTIRPGFLDTSGVAKRSRFRLMELSQPTENLTLPGNSTTSTWFSTAATDSSATRAARMLAENIILLVIWPRLSPKDDPAGSQLTGNYSYNTAPTGTKPQPVQEHQLPPTVQVTMVAIDEASAKRLAQTNGATAPALVDAAWFTDVSQYDDDLNQKLVPRLNDQKITYRIFNSTVPIRGAKWGAQ